MKIDIYHIVTDVIGIIGIVLIIVIFVLIYSLVIVSIGLLLTIE